MGEGRGVASASSTATNAPLRPPPPQATPQSVTTRGDASAGGDSSAVASSLTQLVAGVVGNTAGRAFAALKLDGTAVSWGDPNEGGVGGYDASKLVNLKTIYANPHT